MLRNTKGFKYGSGSLIIQQLLAGFEERRRFCPAALPPGRKCAAGKVNWRLLFSAKKMFHQQADFAFILQEERLRSEYLGNSLTNRRRLGLINEL